MSLQPLIPPGARTLWLRLKGTMKKRSALNPSSASLTVHASPARPPPITITLFAAAGMRSFLPELTELVALSADEADVMVDVLDHILKALPKRNGPALAVLAGSREGRLRQLSQCPREL